MLKYQNKNLVIGCVGDSSLHHHWIKNSKFDLYLVYFGDDKDYSKDAKYYKKEKGYKYHLIFDLLKENQNIFDYEYIWLPDDDILIDGESIDKLFLFMKKYELWLAQPSIVGWYGVDITLHQKGTILRYTNWIEIMCPCFSGESLKKCHSVFKENKTGWSIETIWNVLLGHPRNKIAIIDDIVAIHTRPVLTGETHNKRENPLKEAMEEAILVYNKWNLEKEVKSDVPFGTIIESEIYCAVEYGRIKKPMEKNIPKEKRYWFPGHTLTNVL